MGAMFTQEVGVATQAAFDEWRLQETRSRPKRIVLFCFGIAGAIGGCALLLLSAPK